MKKNDVVMDKAGGVWLVDEVIPLKKGAYKGDKLVFMKDNPYNIVGCLASNLEVL